jgi:hypothetical protein
MEMTRMQMCQDRRDMVIVILMEDIPDRKMPKALRSLWRRITCLKWPGNEDVDGNRLFWERLDDSVRY